jgi:hypothetical protein
LDYTLDISKEIADLFDKEDLVAYFDFCFLRAGLSSVYGLCKIAKSKKKTDVRNYLSLVFIADLPEPTAANDTLKALNNICDEQLIPLVPRLNSVVSQPVMSTKPEMLLKQLDIFLDDHFQPDQHFIGNKLFPALTKLTGFKTESLVFWEDKAPIAKTAGRETRLPETNRYQPETLIGRLKKMLGF